jgi:hypothetical protein
LTGGFQSRKKDDGVFENQIEFEEESTESS